ncbi:MFS transporter [Brenneria corticis]|uniref:Major facilitator superfamily (MFS) profile domain-containing protein n=1 Tax=Brenneria corticis TaxID=2173106 RepID=A0A2U1TN08_9GAMM|nr:MFS transporter [Brenneria sp. CFCC 11842]PWC10794.1 hypothetical protein DDT56_21150 [Brenneria sp. CFCC 11842]
MDSSKTTQNTPVFQLVGAGLLIVASTYGLARYSYGLFVPAIKSEFGLSQVAIGTIGSCSYIGYLSATLFSPMLSRYAGVRLPVVLGGLAAASGMTIVALANSSAVLALGVMLAGCSPGLAYPPLADAIKQLCQARFQNRVYALINSGTSFGIMISGPLALTVGTGWQSAWLLFAAIAFAATLWSFFVMPAAKKELACTPKDAAASNRTAIADLVKEKLTEPSVRRLFISALLFGIATSVYWIFSVDLITAGGRTASLNGVLFWIVIGIAGIVGGAAGDLVTRYGLKKTLKWSTIAIAAAIALPAFAWGTNTTATLLSATAFGATFILITALYGIWSVACFQNAPSVGFGITFFLISAGQLIFPPIAGLLAERWSLPVVFQLSAAASLFILIMLPPNDMRNM